jgi:cytochrome c553
MVKGLVSTVLGVVVLSAVAALPARAQEIETKLQVCNTCHGQDGRPIDVTIPIIWGQQTSYLVKQLHDYKSKDRENPIMAAFADPIKQDELRKAATIFAAKPWPEHKTPVAAVAEPGGLAVCRICHQPKFEGGLPAPRLAGQSYEYLVGAMRSFADDERTNSADMAKLMKMLSPAERDAIAKYLASL